MTASHVVPVAAGCNARQDGGASNGNSHFPKWPPGCPTREALDFLEQALTTGIPRPYYDGPVERLVLPDGRTLINQTFTLPIELPWHIAHFAPPTATNREPGVLDACHAFSSDAPVCSVWCEVNISPGPGFEASLLKSPSMIPTVDAQNAQARDQQDKTALRETIGAQAPRRSVSYCPEIRGVLPESGSKQVRGGPTEPGTGNEAIMHAPPQRPTSGSRRVVRFKLPQGGADSGNPKIVDSLPRCIVTIKSRAAARKWHELELKKE